jgi:gamma-glutamyltranspeptidase / glutathione hydrolase
MVAASHPAVSFAGARVLADGGNAIDATLAMAAMSWLALPGQCGIGGDAFAVVREPDGRVWCVAGSGYGPDGGDLAFYRSRGLDALPMDGALSVSAPGAVAAIEALHNGGGTRTLDELWAPAVLTAQRGLPCTARTRQDIVAHHEPLARDPGTRDVFLPAGRVPAVGQRLAQPQLAETLCTLAIAPDSFYSGELAERAVTWLGFQGAPFSGDDWSASARVVGEPAIRHRYRGMTLHETALPSPGWMVLQQAAICDGVLSEMDLLDAPSVHHLASAARVAFSDRWELGASDSDFWQHLLDDDSVSRKRRQIADNAAPLAPGLTPIGDTTSTVAVDADGRAVSFIHSLAFTFGAKVTIPGTGMVLNNRLARGAYLIEGHPNQVKPRRRPLHTLNAWIITDDSGRLRHVGNTPGGDGQVQWNMQLISHLLDHGLDPQQAVSAPRFTVFPGSDADVVGQPPELRCESRLGESALAQLGDLGHTVRTLGPWDGGGSALIISADQEHGTLVGGADPRQDGVVLGA